MLLVLMHTLDISFLKVCVSIGSVYVDMSLVRRSYLGWAGGGSSIAKMCQ